MSLLRRLTPRAIFHYGILSLCSWAVIRIVPLFVIPSCSSPGYSPHCPSTIQQAQTTSLLALQVLSLKRHIGGRDTRAFDYYFIAVSAREDPRPELLAELQRLEPTMHFAPASASRISANGVAYHRDSGAEGRILSADVREWTSPTEVIVTVGLSGCGDLCGGETHLTLLCVDGEWTVVGADYDVSG